MKVSPPEDLKVISMSPYEHIHSESSDGRVFLKLSHESGFASYSVNIEITSQEIDSLNNNKEMFITGLRNSFNHARHRFAVGKDRDIEGLNDWKIRKDAISKWNAN